MKSEEKQKALQTLTDNLKTIMSTRDITNILKQYDDGKDPIDTMLKYAIEKGIIGGARDVMTVSNAIPELEVRVADLYDESVEKEKDRLRQETANLQSQWDRRYAGTYKSLSDVPGYGTEWNERCIPDGVSINRGKGRDC